MALSKGWPRGPGKGALLKKGQRSADLGPGACFRMSPLKRQRLPALHLSALLLVVNGLQAYDLELLGSRRNLHLYFVSGAPPQKRFPDRRGGGDESLGGVGFFG